MKKVICILLFYFTLKILFAQTFSLDQSFDVNNDEGFKEYYIIGDKVNARKDTSLQSKVIFKLNFGEEVSCHKLNENWYECQSVRDYDYSLYVSNKYIATTDQFVKECEKKINKNLITLWALEQIYKNKYDYEKSINASLEIIDLYRNNRIPEKDKICVLNRGLACYTQISADKGIVNYESQKLIDFCNQIINENTDSLLISWALVTLSQCYKETGKSELALDLILKAIKEYGKYYILPNWCKYDYYREIALTSAIYSIVRYSNDENTYKHFQNLKKELLKICYDPKSNVASKALACNFLINMGSN